jgi:hypothetical protein
VGRESSGQNLDLTWKMEGKGFSSRPNIDCGREGWIATNCIGPDHKRSRSMAKPTL